MYNFEQMKSPEYLQNRWHQKALKNKKNKLNKKIDKIIKLLKELKNDL